MSRNLEGIYEKVDYRNKTLILLHNNKEAESYPVHWHTAVELIMTETGTYHAVINKEEYILHEGDILIIPPGELHELAAPPTGNRYIMLFDYSILNNIPGFGSVITAISQPRCISRENCHEIYPIISSLFHEIIQEYEESDAYYEAFIYSKLIEIFILVGRKFMRTETLFPDATHNKQKEYITKFNRIFEYINNNYTEDITLDTIASIAGFSKFHFSRLFKQFTDMSFYDYVNQKRVKAAERLLLDPSLTITEVAMQSGFSSISTFNRVFKSFKECTPSEFKNLYRNRNMPKHEFTSHDN